MIQKVGQVLNFNKKAYVAQNNKQGDLQSSPVQNTIQSTSVDPKLLQKYYVSFGARRDAGNVTNNAGPSRLDVLKTNYTQESQDLVERATAIARKYGHSEINELHIEKAALESISGYIDDLDSGAKTLKLDGSYSLPMFFVSKTTPGVLKDKKEREKIKPVIKQEIEDLDKILAATPKSLSTRKKPILSKKIVNGVYDLAQNIAVESQVGFVPVEDAMFLESIFESNQNQVENPLRRFMAKFSEATILDSRKPEEIIHLSLYDEKAKNVLKNLSLGTNMFATYDAKSSSRYLVDSIVDVLKRQKIDFGTMNDANTQVLILNKNVTQDFLTDKVKELGKDKKTNHIVIFNLDELLAKSVISVDGDTNTTTAGIGSDFFDLFENQPKNVKFVIVENKNLYFNNLNNPTIKDAFENFGETSVPVLSTEQTKRAFREQPLLMHKIDVPFSRQAVDRVIEATALLDGAFPEKAQGVMKKLASYYVGKKEITEADVKKYIIEAKDLFRTTKDGSSVEIVFDTGKKLKDILGKDATKREAEAIVKQIKRKTLGTKGAIIYSQDGSVGSGRKFTAKAIAGETKSPYVEINALDFGTKEVDLFGGGGASPEGSMKKLFSLLGAQAEANPTKSAVLFVENFEYFSVGELVSEYHQKAMSQLLKEMENAAKKKLNILVLGSVADPETIGESTIKSFKFIDKIEVESPSRNIKAREEILSRFIKKEHLQIAGATEAEKQSIVKLMAETTDHFPFVYLVNLVNKIKSVAFERGHKQATKADVTEAYLQLTTGRPGSAPIPEHNKKIVTSHECGHALNEHYMYNLAKRQNIPWHLGDDVNFITLDPRGDFGGAMYPKSGGNETYSFEKIFSDIICDFGGHSAEKHFYNVDGSWGITSDMQMATSSAEEAIGIMGQGHHFGKKSLAGMMLQPSQKELEVFEKDRDVILENARIVSDLITKAHTGFNREFTEKYSKLVGTGDCLIQGDTFREEIRGWLGMQSKAKLDELKTLDKTILDIIRAAKNGKKYNMSAKTVPPAIKKIYRSVAHNIK